MKISYVTPYDASDVHNWSGTGSYIAKALASQGAEMEYIGQLSAKAGFSLKLKSKIYRLHGKKISFEREPSIVKKYAAEIQSRLSSDTDVIFSPGSIAVSLLETKKPIVFYTDATFGAMIGFYPGYSKFSKGTMKTGNYIEQQALKKCSLAIYSSDWAAKSAIDLYNISPDKIKVVPFGANIECDRDSDKIKEIVDARSRKECHLLFLAVDWQRKGGDLAVNIAKNLNKKGLKTTLHVVGIKKIPLQPLPNFVVDYGFISKSTREGIDKINKLLSESHFLLLPTLADCTPVVYSEANSFGLPCITTNVGGIPTIIKDNINGKLFPLSANADGYTEYIFSMFNDPEAYKRLSFSSFTEYEQRLNWNAASKSIMGLLSNM